jgi:hypothetical protein
MKQREWYWIRLPVSAAVCVRKMHSFSAQLLFPWPRNSMQYCFCRGWTTILLIKKPAHQQEHDMKNKVTVMTWIGAVASLLTLVCIVVLLLHLFRIEKELAAQKVTLECAQQERATMQTFSEKVYQTVVSALETRDSTQQEIARALVTAMNDDPVRDQLLNVMNESRLTVASVKRRISHVLTVENTFEYEESEASRITVPKDSKDWKNWNYDIFFLEERRSDSLLSQAIVRKMVDNGYKGRIRVRMMPNSVNSRTGYRVSVPEVRYNTWEKRGAEEVKTLLDNFGPAKEVVFSLRTVTMNTPNYISIFVMKK